MILKPLAREDLSPSMRAKLPVRFNERHEQAYTIYLELGAERNFKKVAEKMGVSAATIGNWSLAYGWTDRLRTDIEGKNEQGLIGYFTKIAAVRNNGIELVDNIMGIVKDSLDIINVARKDKRKLTEQEIAELANQKSYLSALGFKLSTGKDLRDFIDALREIIEFQPGGGGVITNGGGRKASMPGINVAAGGSVLILQGLKAEEAKEVLNDQVSASGVRGDDKPNSP